MATPVVAPFVPDSGLAEAVRRLGDHLAKLGHDVTIIAPLHGDSAQRLQFFHDHQFELLDLSIEVPVGPNCVSGKIVRIDPQPGEPAILLIDQPGYFQRRHPFGDEKGDYRDNCERFVFFCRSVLETIRRLELEPQVIQCHDWPTGLIPALLSIEYGNANGFESTASVMTIHNAAHQGQFWHWDMLLTGLDWKHFNWQQMEFFGKLNFLKTGIVFGDAISTVSQAYARSLLTEDQGCGLHGVLRGRTGALTGIQYGIDLERWNPESDPHLNRNYTIRTVTIGKLANKQALQRRLGLSIDPRQMVIGVPGPFEYGRGTDLIPRSLSDFLRRGVQCVFLGRGDALIEESIRQLCECHPHQASATFTDDQSSMSLLLGAADLLLFPHRAEPSGCDAMIGCRYGALPLAHQAGGLPDVVEDVRHAGRADSAANGFLFAGLESQYLTGALERARSLFHFPEQWQEIVRNAMLWNWSWNISALNHTRLFEQVCQFSSSPRSGPGRRSHQEVGNGEHYGGIDSLGYSTKVGIEHL